MYIGANQPSKLDSLRKDFLENFGKLSNPEDTFKRLIGFVTL